MKHDHKRLSLSLLFLAAFVAWTLALLLVDVRAIGPLDSPVGFAALNRLVHDLTGVHLWLYELTDLLSLIPLGLVAGFGCLGLVQWLRRKDLRRVDPDILALGVFYLAVLGSFAFFEVAVINYRPVLIDGHLEASYPSSTTMLILCVIPTAMMQLRRRMADTPLRTALILAGRIFLIFMVLGRLVSGVHWFTDIVGGILLSSGLVGLYGWAEMQFDRS